MGFKRGKWVLFALLVSSSVYTSPSEPVQRPVEPTVAATPPSSPSPAPAAASAPSSLPRAHAPPSPQPPTPSARVKLEPRIRIEPPISEREAVSMEAIRPFLQSSLMLDDKKQFEAAPVVVAQDEKRLEGSPGSLLYVYGTENIQEANYTLYREGKTYKHPITKEVLGFEANAIGTAELTAISSSREETVQFRVTKADGPIEMGTRLFPSFTANLPSYLTMQPAEAIIEEGYILGVKDGVDQIGRNSVIVVSLGQREGLGEGDVLEIYQTGRIIKDPFDKSWRPRKIQLPEVKVGKLLIFQTYDKLSVGLVVEATEIIHLLDKVKCP